MQPFIFPLILATMAHVTGASPVSSRQGVAKSSGPVVATYGASAAAIKSRHDGHDGQKVDPAAAGATGQGNTGQGKGQNTGKGNTGKGKRANGEFSNDLIPDFGITRGANPFPGQVGSCTGKANGNAAAIPCFCPPPRAEFVAKLQQAVSAGQKVVVKNAAGGTVEKPIQFSTDFNDRSVATEKNRATAATIVLQNFNGTDGVGCPSSSYPLIAQQQLSGKTQRTSVREP